MPEGTEPKKKDFTQMSALQGKDYGKSKMKSAPAFFFFVTLE